MDILLPVYEILRPVEIILVIFMIRVDFFPWSSLKNLDSLEFFSSSF